MIVTDSSPIFLESLSDRILTITLNRPERRNAIVAGTTVELNEILQRAAIDPAVGAIVLTGAGSTFCVGGDVSAISTSKPITTDEMRKNLKDSAKTVLLLRSIPKPTIAMIRGAVAGGGLGLALGCDLRYGDQTTKMTYAYTKIALAGDYAVNVLLDRTLGAVKAREFALFSPVLGAAECASLGLLNEVFNAEELEACVTEKARQLAHSSTVTLGAIKTNLNAAAELSIDEALAIEAENFITGTSTVDHRESAQAFLEKRKPKFNQK